MLIRVYAKNSTTGTIDFSQSYIMPAQGASRFPTSLFSRKPIAMHEIVPPQVATSLSILDRISWTEISDSHPSSAVVLNEAPFTTVPIVITGRIDKRFALLSGVGDWYPAQNKQLSDGEPLSNITPL